MTTTRQVQLLCPTCGGNQFETSEENSQKINCPCGQSFSKDELIASNQESINCHIEEIKKETMVSLKDQFKQALRGNKFIKVS